MTTISVGRESYNFALLGAAGTGKSCLISCFTRGLFLEHHAPTIDDEYKKTISFGTEVDLSLADLGGWHVDSLEQEWIQRIKWSNGLVLVYDCTNRASFDMLEDIKQKVDQIKDIKPTDEHKFPMIVVGTKADLEDQRAVSGSELKKWADDHGISYYTEVGLAKDVYGAKEVFVRLIGDIRAQDQAKKEASKAPSQDTEKRKSTLSPRAILSPRKRGTTISTAEKVSTEESEDAAAKEEAKAKEKEMKQEQKEKEKEMKKQQKEQKAKEKEEKDRQKKEQKNKAKAEKVEKLEQKKQEKLLKKAGTTQDQPAVSADSDGQAPAAEPATQSDEQQIQAVESTSAQPEESTPAPVELNLSEIPATPEDKTSEPLTPEQKQEAVKERRKRRETISALLSPRRFSMGGNSHAVQPKEKEDSGSIITRARRGTVSGDIEVVNEGLVSPRGEGVNTMQDKKRSRLSLRRFRRSEIYPKSEQEDPPIPQVQFVRVTKPLDALAEYKISPVPSESPRVPSDAELPVTPVNLPYLAPHVTPAADDSSAEPKPSSPRVRSPTLRTDKSRILPAKPLPTAPSQRELADPSTSTSPSTVAPQPTTTRTIPPGLPTFQSMPKIAVDIPATTAPVSEFEFPNLEDLPIFQDLFPPPSHLGPPPPPPTQSGV